MFKEFFDYMLTPKPTTVEPEVVDTLGEIALRNKANATQNLQEKATELRKKFSTEVELVKKGLRKKVSNGEIFPLYAFFGTLDLRVADFLFILEEEIKDMELWAKSEGLDVTRPEEEIFGTFRFRFDIAKETVDG